MVTAVGGGLSVWPCRLIESVYGVFHSGVGGRTLSELEFVVRRLPRSGHFQIEQDHPHSHWRSAFGKDQDGNIGRRGGLDFGRRRLDDAAITLRAGRAHTF